MLQKIIEFLSKVARFVRNVLLAIIVLALLVFFVFVGSMVDKAKNTRELPADAPLVVSERTRRLHPQLQIADWHSDNLLWDRNPLNRLDHGHVDIPRLIEGGFYLQVFGAVIKTPRGLNSQSNVGRSDNITFLAMANRWPVKSWLSLSERAIYQSKVLHLAADASSKLTIVRSREDLEIFLKLRRNNTNMVAGLLSIEGLHALEEDINNLEQFFEAGYRMMGLVHFFDNEVGGSSAGVEKGGLTDFGRSVIRVMNERDIIIDLAHASEDLLSDVIRTSTKPVVVSHTGVKSTHESPRNLSDQQLRMIAEKGGMIGIGFWEGAVGSTSIQDIVTALQHAVSVAGIDHVGLGSDFDGATTIRFDASQIILLTDGLVTAGFTDEEIKKIMGGNQIRFLLENLPSERTSYR